MMVNHPTKVLLTKVLIETSAEDELMPHKIDAMGWCELSRLVIRHEEEKPKSLFDSALNIITDALQRGNDLLIENIILPQHVSRQRWEVSDCVGADWSDQGCCSPSVILLISSR